MKKFTLLLCCLLGLSLFLNAQQEGEVIFKQSIKMKLKIDLPDDNLKLAEQLKKMKPSEQVSNHVLYFNEDASLYKAKEGAEAPEDQEYNHEGDGVQIKMKFSRSSSESITYLNLKKEALTEKKDFLGKTFLVQDKDPKLPWKLGTESKKILDYNCRKATAEIDDRTVEAWFPTELPIASGPGTYYGLPGMILEVKSSGENGSRHIVAQELNLKTLEANMIVAP